MTGASIAEELGARSARLEAAALPARLTATAQNLVLDVTGLCIAARRSDYVAAMLAGLDDGAGATATVIGHERTCDTASAILVNGTAAHGEDYDDTFEGGPVHSGAVIVPAMLAAAERHAMSGADLLRGIAVGTELMCRLSLVAPRMVHQAGFHPTAVFGAVAYGLGGVVGVQAAGLLAAETSEAFAFQAGAGVAALAAAGMALTLWAKPSLAAKEERPAA